MPLWWAILRGRWRAGRGRGRWKAEQEDHVVKIGEVLWIGLGESRKGRALVYRLVPGRAEKSMA